ncbi:lipocalin-like domain-containing protein [Lentisalinibacter sediminis]|uniref:lipocalin-like domain-containing protein n=1 Tax=Lentisalinibacter sediminis TaxID=2992237 RepID=UPI003866702B
MAAARHLALSIVLAGALLAGGCDSSPTETAADDSSNVTTFLGSAEDDARFARADAPREFRFPEDHGAHPDYRTEWWYLTGNLETTPGRHFGFQMTFFRFGIDAAPPDRPSAWATDQLWMAHFAVTDTDAGEFHADEKFERQALGLAGAQRMPFRVWLDDWELASADDTGWFPLRLVADGDGFALDLAIDDGKPLVLQGEDGLDPKGPEAGNASYYYSFTRLPAEGRVRVGDTEHAVSGLVWFDREWSTSVLGPGVEGWNWFAIQLDDGYDLMYYRLRQTDGGTAPYSGGILVDPDGGVAARYGAAQARLEATGYWTSPETGIRYTVAWRLQVPHLGIDLAVTPRMPGQELDLSVRYWEGAITVDGERDGTRVSGVGYAEHAGVSARGE